MAVQKRSITILMLFVSISVHGQNLVPNPGFDIYTMCPSDASQDTLTPPWSGVDSVLGSPDYMNACFVGGDQGVPSNFYGSQVPVSGTGYYGLITYFINEETREYLTVPLVSPLIGSITYSVGFYISRSDNFEYATDHFGAYLSVGALTGSGTVSALPYVPQIDNPSGNIISDTSNWTLISGTYVAVGGENYLTIGNFSNDLNTQDSIANPFGLGWAYYYIDEVFVTHDPIQIFGNTNVCLGDTVNLAAFNDTLFTWADSLNPSIIIGTGSLISVVPITTTTYFVYGTYDTTSVTVNVIYPPIVNLGNDTTICQGETLTLNGSAPNSVYVWQDNSANPTFTVTQQGTYWIEVTNICETFTDTINVNYQLLPIIYLGNDTTICQGETLTLDATGPNTAYLWQDNSANPTFTVTQQGIYWVEVSINNCSSTDTININYFSLLKISLGNDTTICEGAMFTLDATSPNVSYLWQDNSVNSTLLVTQQGTYWVKVINSCEIISDTIVIEPGECDCKLCIPDAFTPDGFGIDINNKLYVFNKLANHGDVLEMISLKIFNRWGELIFEASEISQIVYPEGGWDGSHMKSGKKTEVGVYVWLMEAHALKAGKIGPISGNVSLIR